MLSLEEGLKSNNNKKIIYALEKLRKASRTCGINKETFKLLVKLIEMPNENILNYALSILANCCLNDTYRRMFIELGGVSHVMIIINSVDSNSIICRACRLVGNLAFNRSIVKTLSEHNAALSLIGVIEKNEGLSTDTLTMAFRAFKKIWPVSQTKWEVLPDDMILIFYKHLNNDNKHLVQLILESLILITNCKRSMKKKKLVVSKEFFLKLIDLSNNVNFFKLTIACLSNLICYWTSYIWTFLEGSKIAEIFIDYLENVDDVPEKTCKAFYKLCTEGAIRSKVRLSGLLSKLIESNNIKNDKNLLSIFSLFQYDLASMKICSENHKFISILIKNIELPESIQILTVFSRLVPPSKELVSNQNLDVFVKNNKCCGILKNIVSAAEFLRPIILSGKVWQIEKAGCKMENIHNPGYIEYLLIQLLIQSKDEKGKEEVSLAVPFLVETRNAEVLYKLLIKYGVMPIIISLLHRSPMEEKVLASIVRLITIFKSNYQTPENFFQDLAGGEIPSFPNSDPAFSGEDSVVDLVPKNSDESKTIEFMFDDGKSLSVNRDLVCSKSPVLNSMLNGHFVEAQQHKVRLRNCSQKSFSLLVKYLNGHDNFSDVEMETYLELLSLSDRFLLFNLNIHLTANFKIDTEGCSAAYKWYRQAGHTGNIRIIGQKIYECIFSSTENLLTTMKDELCRHSLVQEITKLLSDFSKELS